MNAWASNQNEGERATAFAPFVSALLHLQLSSQILRPAFSERVE